MLVMCQWRRPSIFGMYRSIITQESTNDPYRKNFVCPEYQSNQPVAGPVQHFTLSGRRFFMSYICRKAAVNLNAKENKNIY